MHHWTEHNIRVHTFTCALALLYQGERGRPRARRMLTETSPVQDKID